MSDYTTPAVSDAAVNNLAEAIDAFAQSTDINLLEIKDTINKYYTVNHEPKIELPFEGEYDYICEKVNKSLSSSKKLDKFTHTFISGYLPKGKTIRYNALETDDRGFTHSRYSGIFINGKQYYTDYTCRAEDGTRERLNILIVGAPKMGSDKARLNIDYADIPLEDFKLIVFDDVDEPTNPDIDSFLASKQIDTLKVIGDYQWTYSGLCTLRRLELTKDILVINQMECPCIQELIIPNVTNVPNISSEGVKPAIVTLDISNVRGAINYLSGINIDTDLILRCASLAGLSGAKIRKLYTGDYCTTLMSTAFRQSTVQEVYIGRGCINIGGEVFKDCKNLRKVVFENFSPFRMSGSDHFSNCTALTDVHFASIGNIALYTFVGCGALANLTFSESISTNLYFSSSQVLTETSCLNIINSIADGAKISVALHSTVKTCMANDWYCKLENGVYVSCTSEDEGAMLQTAALIARGGTLA